MSSPLTQLARSCAGAALWTALGVQLAWLTLNATVLHRHPGMDAIGAVILVVALIFAGLHRRSRWAAVAMRIVMAAEFLLAVADRFRLLGAPGQAGVQWGSFANFVSYTRSVIAFLPDDIAPTAAIGATVAEIALGIALLLGLQIRLAAAGAGALLVLYATAMSISLPAAEQFHYNVIVLCTTMFALATSDGPVRARRRVVGLRRLVPTRGVDWDARRAGRRRARRAPQLREDVR